MKRSSTDSLRLDSLVYDANHRVTRTIDALGHVSQVVYDGNGNVVQSITPTNDTTLFWYRTDGLLDSTRAPHNLAVAHHFTYDATTKNLTQVKSDTVLIATHYYDGFGRDTASDAKTPVQATATTPQWQWRRHETFYNEANQADSARLLRTDNCNDPCGTPSWPVGPDTNTTHAQHVRYTRDRAGRDSLRINDRGTKTAYVYDRLGRLLRRRPWVDSAGVQDTFVYNVAGNLWKTMTRRGDVITSAYDSRNRDTLTVIPGVGTLRKLYGGPLDELTREWLDSPVDSIGGVNVELRWGYDTRGRLRADTSYTGATARATTYAYDTYERPLASTDPLGTWTTKYDASRGVADTLLTPLGDTVSYAFDGLGRGLGPTIHGGGSSQDLAPTWNAQQELRSLTQTVGGASSYHVFTWLRKLLTDDGAHAPLNPATLVQTSAAATPDTLQDSVTYDGWQRVTAVVSYKGQGNPQLVARDTFAFDRVGNIKTTAGAEVYDVETTRLTAHAGAGCTWAYTYDRAGNLTQATCGSTTRTYQYDGVNQLRSVRSGSTLIARYAYDVLGRRIVKCVYSGSTCGTGYTRFVYHGSAVAFETDSAGTIGLRYTWDGTDQLLAVAPDTVAAHRYYAVSDKLSSVRGLVRRDGTWIMSQRFGPYGAVIARDTNSSASPGFVLRYGWTGREYDPETGFYFFRSRYYDLTVRRFVQEDPAGYAGGTNLYAYVGGDVMEARDPSGMLAQNTGGGDPYFFQVCENYPCLGLDGPFVGGDGGGGGDAAFDAWAADIFGDQHQYAHTVTWCTDEGCSSTVVWAPPLASVDAILSEAAIGAEGIGHNTTRFYYADGHYTDMRGTLPARDNNPGDVSYRDALASGGVIGQDQGKAIFGTGNAGAAAAWDHYYAMGYENDDPATAFRGWQVAPGEPAPLLVDELRDAARAGVNLGSPLGWQTANQQGTWMHLLWRYEGYNVPTQQVGWGWWY
jgi:RHS repeat-associated protein